MVDTIIRMAISGVMGTEMGAAQTSAEREEISTALQKLTGMKVYARSIAGLDGTLYCLANNGEEKRLIVISKNPDHITSFHGDTRNLSADRADGDNWSILDGPVNEHNAQSLRVVLPFLNAQRLGLSKSVGCGDRLGLATPGHVRAIRRFQEQSGQGMGLIAAQQSVRENARTGRNPRQVMDDAMWGVFEEGWRGGFGADADHLKVPEDVAPWAAAGFTFYTIDPGEHVDDESETATSNVLREKVNALPWTALESSPDELFKRYLRPIDIDTEVVHMDENVLLKAAVKYGKAVAHTAVMYRHLVQTIGEDAFELEVSVDETATVTTVEEHVFIASELKRLGVEWVSLAPRYVGEFEKGVDYIGDIDAFRTEFSRHVAVATTFGPYKLSLHSGSDKFSIYPIVSELAGEYVHLKTAGTSYLEALRTVARVNPPLFKNLLDFAVGRYATDRATYFVSGHPERMPAYADMDGDQLTEIIDQFDTRQVLHVTFGSVLNDETFRSGIYEVLRSKEEVHYEMIAKHFARHLSPFGGV